MKLTEQGLKKVAEILVECGYAIDVFEFEYQGVMHCDTVRIKDESWPSKDNIRLQKVEVLSDTLEGRRQADAIEDWLVQNHKQLWLSSMNQFGFDDRPKHQWRLDRIKWCLEAMSNG